MEAVLKLSYTYRHTNACKESEAVHITKKCTLKVVILLLTNGTSLKQLMPTGKLVNQLTSQGDFSPGDIEFEVHALSLEPAPDYF